VEEVMCLADQKHPQQQQQQQRRRRRRQRGSEGAGQEEEEEEEEEDMRRIRPLLSLLLGTTFCCLPLVGGMVKRGLERGRLEIKVGSLHRQGARLLRLLLLLVVLFGPVVLLLVVSEL
jgi:hypothetical protein